MWTRFLVTESNWSTTIVWYMWTRFFATNSWPIRTVGTGGRGFRPTGCGGLPAHHLRSYLQERGDLLQLQVSLSLLTHIWYGIHLNQKKYFVLEIAYNSSSVPVGWCRASGSLCRNWNLFSVRIWICGRGAGSDPFPCFFYIFCPGVLHYAPYTFS